MGFFVLVVLAGFSTSASAVDPDTARRKYTQCRQLSDVNDPCAAQKACTDGLHALRTSALEKLHAEVKAACDEKVKASRRRRKLRQDCELPGQVRTLDNDAECCWLGQRWDGRKCREVPSQCPDGYHVDEAAEACALTACDEGKLHVDGQHCCWEDQVWAESQRRCYGSPSCPELLEAKGDACFPIIPDEDRDGIADSLDSCPQEQEDYDEVEDEDGCPEPDNDNDGVCDPIIATWGKNKGEYGCRGADTCPFDSEDVDGFEDNDGCPDLDNDADGLADTEDRCPDEKGKLEDGGCPPPPDRTFEILGWVGVGVGTAFLGTGIGLQLWAESMRDEIRSAPIGANGSILTLTETEALALESDANGASVGGITGIALGAGMVTAGAVMLVFDSMLEGRNSDSAAPQFSFGLGIDGVSLQFNY